MITGLLVKEFNRNINPRTGLGSVSIKAFYLRRARRILPAALFVIIAINLWAQFRLNILQVSQIKADSVWTIFFGANITFLRQATDYFAQNNAVSPLQHYWSLSVEEQFYTVWPVLFLAALSFSTLAIRGRLIEWQTRLRTVFAVIGIVSFAWLIFEFTNSPTTAYFSTFSRAWELALGGLLSMVSFSSVAERFRPQIRVLRFISLLAVVGAIGIVTPKNFGYTLVIPAVATGLLLLTGAHAKGDLVYRLLSSRALNGLGAISFSLYLWHWPVFVFGRQEGWMESLPQKVVGVVVCIVLGTVSYFLVEKTFLAIPLPKSQKQGPPKAREFSFAKSRVLTSLTTFAVVAGLVGITYPSAYGSTSTATVASEDWIPPATAASFAPVQQGTSTLIQQIGLIPEGMSFEDYQRSWQSKVSAGVALKRIPSNLHPNLSELSKLKANFWSNCPGHTTLAATDTKVCSIGNVHSDFQAVLLGDSQARVLWPMVVKSLDLSKWGLTLLGQGNCPVATFSLPMNQQFDWNKKCTQHRDFTWNYVKTHKPKLVIASEARYGGVPIPEIQSGLEDAFRHLVPFSKKVIYVGQSGYTPDLNKCAGKDGSLANCEMWGNRSKNVQRAELTASRATSVSYFPLIQYLCTSVSLTGKCPPIIGNIATHYDDSHLTIPLAEGISPFFVKFLGDREVPDLTPIESNSKESTSQDTMLLGSAFRKAWLSDLIADTKLLVLPSHLDVSLQQLKNEWGDSYLNTQCKVYKDSVYDGRVCRIGNPKGKVVALVGDSLSMNTFPALVAAVNLQQWQVVMISKPGCRYSNFDQLYQGRPWEKCNSWKQFRLAELSKLHPSLIVAQESVRPNTKLNNPITISGAGANQSKNFDLWAHGYSESITNFLRFSKNLLVIASNPGLDSGLNVCLPSNLSLASCGRSVEGLLQDMPFSKYQYSDAQKRQYGFLNPSDWVCVQGRCPAISRNVPIYIDEMHFTKTFASKQFSQVVSYQLQRSFPALEFR